MRAANIYEIRGVKHTIVEWCDIYEVDKSAVANLIRIKKMSIEEALIYQSQHQRAYKYNIVDASTGEVLHSNVVGKVACAKLLGMKLSEVNNMIASEKPKYLFQYADMDKDDTDFNFPYDLLSRWDKARKKLNPNAK